MKLYKIILVLSIVFVFAQETRIDCANFRFCDENDDFYSEFVCEQICKEQHNRMINDCDDDLRQFYKSITHTQASAYYSSLTGNLFAPNTTTLPIELTNRIFSYNNIQSSLIDFTYISENIYENLWWDHDDSYSYFGDDENYRYGWGSILINNDEGSNENIAIHVNHPLHDMWSDMIAGYIFESSLKPKWMISAGAHRYSWVDGDDDPTWDIAYDATGVYDEPNNCSVDVECESNFGADVARQEEDCFGSSYTTLSQIYHESLSDNIESLFSLSIHSFSSDSLDMNNTLLTPYGDIAPSFIITNGNDGIENDCIPPDQTTSTIYHYLNDYFSNAGNFNTVDSDIYDLYIDECNEENIAIIVQQEINCNEQNSINGTSCSDSGASPFSQYGGHQNPQGKYTNGYYDASINVGNPQIIDDIWMQIEISDCIRDDIMLYEKTSWIISKAIEDCKVNGICIECDMNTPCSSYNVTGQGVDYSSWDYNCGCLVGDINCNGNIDVDDIIIIVNLIISNNFDELADINDDGIVNIIDIVMLIQQILYP